MKKWQIENSETSEISEIFFRVFLFSSFRFCPIVKIENSDLKISEKNFRFFPDFHFSKFSTWPSKANVKTNRMANTKWAYHKEWSFASNYFIFLENLFQF